MNLEEALLLTRRRRDSSTENLVVRMLRELPEAHRIERMLRIYSEQHPLSFEIARRTLTTRTLAEPFLSVVVSRGRLDAQTVRMLIEYFGPKLGLRRTLLVLAAELPRQPDLAGIVEYWLRRQLPTKQANAAVALFHRAGASAS
ncbi:MAG: hypothetical protein AB1938_20040 [Myxococcota bacterium]